MLKRKVPAVWAKRIRRWRDAAVVNVYRGLGLLLIGASPVLLRVAIGTPGRAAALLGAWLALRNNTRVLSQLWKAAPVPKVARDAMADDWARFLVLTAKGPIYRGVVALIKRCVDCQVAPAAPSSIKVSAVKSTSAKLQWEPTVISVLSDEGYRLDITRSEGPSDEDDKVTWRQLYDGSDKSLEVKDLIPGALYRCRVVAHNTKGISASKGVRFVTPQEPTPRKGGVAPAYTWSQNTKEVIMRFCLPGGTKGRDVTALCSGTTLHFEVAAGTTAARVLCSGTLHRPVKKDEFAWQFVDHDEADEREKAAAAEGGRVVELTLPKADGEYGRRLWPSVISAAADSGPVSAKSLVALHLEHPRIDVSLVKEEVPELSDHHLRELHDMMKGAPVGGGDSSDD